MVGGSGEGLSPSARSKKGKLMVKGELISRLPNTHLEGNFKDKKMSLTGKGSSPIPTLKAISKTQRCALLSTQHKNWWFVTNTHLGTVVGVFPGCGLEVSVGSVFTRCTACLQRRERLQTTQKETLTHFCPPFKHLLSERLRLSA